MRFTLRRSAAILVVLALTIAPGLALRPGGTGAAVAAPGTPATTQKPDFFYYRRLLEDYLIVTHSGSALETNFDYTGLYIDPAKTERLTRARRALISEIAPSKMDARTRLAWAINTYNFLVIETVANHLFPTRLARGMYNGKRGYVRQAHESVMNITLPEGPFFEAPLAEIEGVSYSLNRFERHFIFADYDAASKHPAPKSLDPRAHFAIVCGARGCPPLSPRPYEPDSLTAQLDLACRNALSLPTQLAWNAATGTLRASSIFQWYVADFGGGPKAFAFVKRYAPDSVVAELEQRKATGISGYIPWNWKLNQANVRHGPDSTGAVPGAEADSAR
jgi:hypothetical protein